MDEALSYEDITVELESSYFWFDVMPPYETLLRIKGNVPAGNYQINLTIRLKDSPQVALKKTIYVTAV